MINPGHEQRHEQPDTMDTAAIDGFKQGARQMWASGDYPDVAERNIWDVGARLVRHVGVHRGDDVLDVACGSGNVAIRAAQAGANVVGLDLTPELFGRARELAGEAGVRVELLEGDAEALPFGGDSFDAVFSSFGCMFAPRHELAAREMARVLRAGGTIGIVSWTPEGSIGRFFMILAGYMPSPPEFASPPVLWGSPDHVRQIFEGTGVDLTFKRETVESPEFDSTDQALDYWTTKFGPVIRAKALAEADGRWPELREKLREHYATNEPLEYLVTIGRKD